MKQILIDAHNAWQKAEGKIPRNEWEKGYKSRQATVRKLWRTFSDVCKAEGLKPVDVAMSLTPKKLSL